MTSRNYFVTMTNKRFFSCCGLFTACFEVDYMGLYSFLHGFLVYVNTPHPLH